MKKLTKRQYKAASALNLDLFESAVVPFPILPVPDPIVPVRPADLPVVSPDTAPSLPVPGELPDVATLYRLFDRYNWMYFEGRLTRPTIEYSGRMTSAGMYMPRRHLIRIGRKYHEIFSDEVADTLKHEMIHILHLRHDAAFKAEAKRVGASVRARSHPALRRPARYLYVCPGCGMEYPRQKRLRMASCGKCSKGGRYDERFKLRLKKPAG
ncbi:MAG: SprT-like domain-containing protein [candidate division Zixibacteria bacterium]|nr:SprT-like domain-containing protein [candidate division Zixibacteria bacterium]